MKSYNCNFQPALHLLEKIPKQNRGRCRTAGRFLAHGATRHVIHIDLLKLNEGSKLHGLHLTSIQKTHSRASLEALKQPEHKNNIPDKHN